MKKIRVNWAAVLAVLSALAMGTGIAGIAAFAIAAGVTQNMWWLTGVVPAILCYGIGVELL